MENHDLGGVQNIYFLPSIHGFSLKMSVSPIGSLPFKQIVRHFPPKKTMIIRQKRVQKIHQKNLGTQKIEVLYLGSWAVLGGEDRVILFPCFGVF